MLTLKNSLILAYNKQEVSKLIVHNKTATVAENFVYLLSIWANKYLQNSGDFFKWWKNKVVASALEALLKKIENHHKEIDLLKLRCTMPNLVSTFLQKSTNFDFYHSSETDKVLHGEKIRLVDRPVSTRKAVGDETFSSELTDSHF